MTQTLKLPEEKFKAHVIKMLHEPITNTLNENRRSQRIHGVCPFSVANNKIPQTWSVLMKRGLLGLMVLKVKG